MKYPDTKIEQATNNSQDSRYYLDNPYLDTANARLIATDGHILAILPVELAHADTAGPVPVDALKAARTKDNHERGESAYLSCNGICQTANGASYSRGDMDITFPDVDKVIPDKPQDKADICFNAKLFAKLVDAITDRSTKEPIVTVWLPKDKEGNITDGPIRIEVNKDDTRIGVIMSCRQ